METNFKYRKDFDEAKQCLDDLLKQREELEVSIAKQKRKVAALAQLCEDNEGIAVDPKLDLGGLTDACRTVLRASRKEWMTIGEIRTALEDIGFPIHKYRAIAASITTTVNRLVEAHEARDARISGDGRVYKWIGPAFGAKGMEYALRETARKKEKQ